MRRIKQVRTYGSPAQAAARRRTAATRAGYLAEPTTRMLDQARIRRGHRVLAIGVGIGEEAIAAAPRVGSEGEVVATDASVAMIAEAKRAVYPAGLRSVRCLHMDAQRLDFEPESFNAIIARNALMFIPDLRGALEEVKRVLRAGGRISATVWATGQRNPRMYDPRALRAPVARCLRRKQRTVSRCISASRVS